MLTFNDILGQQPALDTLTRAYAANRLPHGMIFAGPSGVGKATTARALAALFLCSQPQDSTLSTQDYPTPCGVCDSCRALESNAHPDYHVITKELIRYHDKTGKSKGIDLSVHVIRPELIEPAGRKPMLGHGKVFVIEEADAMNPQAQNALLKTLEEPAGPTLIILLTDQPNSLLQTIRSRCQLIPFAALDDATVFKQLEKRKIDRQTAQDATAFSEGSLGLALKWISDGVVPRAADLVHQLDSLVAGHSPDGLEVWFKSAAEEYAEKQLKRDELASKDQATREGLALYLRLAATYFRTRMQASTDPAELERLCGAIDAIAKAENYLWCNVNIPLIFQQLTLAWERELASART